MVKVRTIKVKRDRREKRCRAVLAVQHAFLAVEYSVLMARRIQGHSPRMREAFFKGSDRRVVRLRCALEDCGISLPISLAERFGNPVEFPADRATSST